MGKKFDERTNRIENGVENKFQNGVHNSILIFLTFFIISLVIDNYLSYGIIRTPWELVHEFLEFLNKFGWIFPTYFTAIAAQFLFCITIENLLLYEIILEDVGSILQVLNSLFVFNTLSILHFRYDFNCIAGWYLLGGYIHPTLKFWSYACTNKKLRNKYKMEKNKIKVTQATTKKNPDGIINYPDNISLYHLVEFVIGTGHLVYKNEKPKKSPRDFKLLLKRIVLIPFLCFFSAFVIYQYIIPESDNAVTYVNHGEYLMIVSSMLNLSVPIFVVWLAMFYYHNYKCLFPLFPMLFGNEEVVLVKDWWNSSSAQSYWANWNYQTHLWFKFHVFKPVLEMGFTKFQASLAVILVSGLLHEYLITIPCQCGYGSALFGMAVQILIMPQFSTFQKLYGNNVGNIASLTLLYLTNTLFHFTMYHSRAKSF